MRLSFVSALIASFVLVLGAAPGFAQQYPPEEPVATVALDASSYAVGDTVNGTGTGFTPGEEVEVWLLSTPQLMTVVTADDEGVATFSFEIPSNIAPGEHHVQLVGRTSGVVVTSAPFTVVAAAEERAVGALPVTGQWGFPLVWVALAALAFGTAGIVAFRRRALARVGADR